MSALTNDQCRLFSERVEGIKRQVCEGKLSFRIAMGGLKKVLDGQVVASGLSVPLDIELGLYKNGRAYKEAIKKLGGVSAWAGAILDTPGFVCAPKKTRVRLAFLSVAELGFGEGSLYRNICSRAEERDYRMCPAEVGPALRLAYRDQLVGEKLVVAMKPILGANRNNAIFSLCNEDVGFHCLRCASGNPGHYFRPEYIFAFIHQS